MTAPIGVNSLRRGVRAVTVDWLMGVCGRGARHYVAGLWLRLIHTAGRYTLVTRRAGSLGCQPRNAAIGSVRVARHAGTRHAASAARTITTTADTNASGSRRLTRYTKYPISRASADAS